MRLALWKSKRNVPSEIASLAQKWESLSEQELRRTATEIRWRARSGTPLESLVTEAFALVREVSRRVLGMSHYPVQLTAGVALFDGGLAEMQTGEGKTLTAGLPVYLRALLGNGAHVVTANDYLAERDAEFLRPVFQWLGLSVGYVLADSTPDARAAAYACDITYATSREVGFDFLRDRLAYAAAGVTPEDNRSDRPYRILGASSVPGCVQRKLYYALVDEADSVLLDDAITPLIIGVEGEATAESVALHAWCRDRISTLKHEEDYLIDARTTQIHLTDSGCRRLILMDKPASLNRCDSETLYRHIELALRAGLVLKLGKHYLVNAKGEIEIVDESTGRIMDGRKWQSGLHQAVESKEGVEITAETGVAARVTVQSFFRQYRYLAGMTGTARGGDREMRKTYGLKLSVIPTHRPGIRKIGPTHIFATRDAKEKALCAEIARLHAVGRPVLLGTPSVVASMRLADRLSALGLPHQVLNAQRHEEEAAIIADAGELGRITVATNMAGRGTDIVPTDETRKLGGLVVIATEMHSSNRIDRQLIGRCARQGDPGFAQFWLSLDDELFNTLPEARVNGWKERALQEKSPELPASWIRVFRIAQRLAEDRARRDRQVMLAAERAKHTSCRELGVDPYLDLVET